MGSAIIMKSPRGQMCKWFFGIRYPPSNGQNNIVTKKAKFPTISGGWDIKLLVRMLDVVLAEVHATKI